MKKSNDKKRPNVSSRSLGQFLRSRERLVHCAKAAQMIPNPLKAVTEALGKPFIGPELIPWTSGGITWRQGEPMQTVAGAIEAEIQP